MACHQTWKCFDNLNLVWKFCSQHRTPPWYASRSDSLFFNVNSTGDIAPLEVCTFAAVIESVATGAGLTHVSMSAMMTANVAKIWIGITFLLRPLGLAAQAVDQETDSSDNIVPRASQRGVY